MKSLEIISRHSNLLDAVKAACIDLSYNEASALQDIKLIDNPPARYRTGPHASQPCTEAFVVRESETGNIEVYYTYQCDLRLLNKFTPFYACLHNGAFSLADSAHNTISISDGITPDRKAMASALKTAPHMWACKL